MSGGQLVVLDRLGRDVKRFPLAEGLVTLGSDHSCDIRFMLDAVNPHHATVAVHANQTVVRNVCEGETLVNDRPVSVAALRHGDVISIGGRQLRWDYADPSARRVQAPQPALYVARRKTRVPRRRSGPASTARRDPTLRLAIEMSHRASMPANAGGKQVAIVQPQRRDTSEQNDKPPLRSPLQANKRPRASKNDLDISINSDSEGEKAKRKSNARVSPKATVANLQNTTKATLWIESRKSSPRKSVKIQTPIQNVLNIRRNTMSVKKSTPLRLTVLKRAQSAQKNKVTKIQAPLEIDHTKQAALLLMTGHTPKSKLVSQKTPSSKTQSVTSKSASVKSVTPKSTSEKSVTSESPKVTPKAATSKSVTPKSASPKSVTPKVGKRSSGRRSASFVVKKKSPIRKSTPRSSSGRKSTRASAVSAVTASPQDRTVTILEITDSDGRNSTRRSSLRRSGQQSPLLPSPKKSALKDPLAKKSMRKTESIKFDLSNLENYSQEESDVLMVTDTTKQSEGESAFEDDISLHYSESSGQSPSPRRSIHSRSSKILENSLGTTMTLSSPSRTLTPQSPRSRKSLRGSLILQKALDKSDDTLQYSRRTTKSLSDASQGTVASAFRTRTLSPRTPQNDMESYSIVDLVSIDSNESGRSTSVYNSAGSTNNTFGTPQNGSARTTRSTITGDLIGSSTPYVKGSRSSTSRSTSSPHTSKTSNNSTRLSSKSSVSLRKSKSDITPENTTQHVSVNSVRISRASRSRSRINESDLVLLDSKENDDSPRSSKRTSTTSKRSSSAPQSRSSSKATSVGSPSDQGMCTPENRQSPEEVSTPVLSIQSLLDSSHTSIPSQSSKKRGRPSLKRKTIGVLTGPKARASIKSKSMNYSGRKTRLRLSNDSYENMNVSNQQDEEIVTPKSAVKLVQEAVKNKHSTAKKPQSKRSIIDDLNDSDIVKQLFNSPVKRKLSQSMTEFSRKQLFDDDEVVKARRPTRNTIALSGRTPEHSLLNHTETFTPERFVSPISTPSHSPNLTGVKLLFGKKTPENDLRNIRGVKGLLRTPQVRKSIRNDLTDVAGVKAVFAKSPTNRLSDVKVKEVFVSSPKNDLRRVTGVKTLFQSEHKRTSPRNSLGDVRGVKKLFGRNSPDNDLTNISGVKKILRKNSPRNDLSDVRGVKRMFRRDDKQRNELNDMSGVEELFNESTQSHRDAESLFDQLVGKPVIKSVYSKTFSTKSAKKIRPRKNKSLRKSIDMITNDVEQWLEQELNKRLHNGTVLNKTASRELQKLATDTVEGTTPLCNSRIRSSTIARTSIADESQKQRSASEVYSARKLPIKKRSLADLEATKNDSKTFNLPIKKRAVVHSTPVKGRQVNMTMNASELGRVSPIAAEKTQDLYQEAGSTLANETVQARPKSRRGTKAPQSPETKSSPRKTRASKSRVPSPTKATPAKTKPATPTKTNQATPLKSKPATPTKSNPATPQAKLTTPRQSKPATPTKANTATSVETMPATPTKPKSPTPKTKPASSRKSKRVSLRKVTSPRKSKQATPKAKPVIPSKAKQVILKPRPSSPRKSNTSTPSKANPAIPADTKPATPTKAKPETPKPASTRKSKVVSPRKSNVTSSRKSRVASPPKCNVTSPRKSNITSPRKSNVTSPRKSNVTSPRKSNVTLPRKSNIASSRTSNVALPRKYEAASPRKSKAASLRKSKQATPKTKPVTPNKAKQVILKPRPASPRKSNAETPAKAKLATSKIKPASSRKSKAASYRKSNVASPRKSNLPTPTKAKSATPKTIPTSPRKSKPASPRKSKPASPRKPNPATPTKAKPATPTKAKPATPTAKPATSTMTKPSTPQAKPPTPKVKPPTPKVKPATPTKEKTPAKTRTSNLAKKSSPAVTMPASPKTTRSRKTIVASPPPKANIKRRGAKIVEENSPAKIVKLSPAKKTVAPVVTKAVSPKTTRSGKTIIASPPAEANTKRRATKLIKEKSPAKKSPAKIVTPIPAKKPATPVVTKSVTPKTTRSRKTVIPSPQVEKNTKKRGAALVIAKKTPFMSPQPRASRKRKEPETLTTPKARPKRNRSTRNNDEKIVEKPKTPKNTRTKVLKATVVVSKPSPQIKPRATRGRAQVSVVEVSTVTKKADAKKKTETQKKTVGKKVESPKKSPVQKKPAKEVSIEEPKTRGRKTAVSKNESKQASADVEQAKPKTKRGRNTTVEEPVVARKTRKAEKQAPVKEPKQKSKKTENVQQVQPVEDTKKTHGGKKVVAQESVQSEPIGRSRRGAKPDTTVIPELPSRKRKSTAIDERPAKVGKSKEYVDTRVRNKKVETPKTEKAVPKKPAAKDSKAKNQASSEVAKKATRSKKADVSVEAPKEPAKRSARGKNSQVVEPAPEVGKRKRKPAVESPVKEASKKPRVAKKPAAASPPKPRATRAAVAPAGRSRRR